MCTSLIYRDAMNRAYLGRTLELSLELPYQIALFPPSLTLGSQVSDHPLLSWNTKHAFIAVTMPLTSPVSQTPMGKQDLKVIEGLNNAGLSFSVQSYSQAGGSQAHVEPTCAVLSAADLGAWVLGQFTTVEEVKTALIEQPVLMEPVPILGGLEMPFHYSVHDASGSSIVIEFHHGAITVYDNPVGVMTNAPQFSWHLANLNNYTFLTNIDRSKSKFGSYDAAQPGAGIAKAGLPSSDTSVDRFVRAAFYAQYAEKQTDPDQAVKMVAHLMNNFDRPRGITIDYPDQGSAHLKVQGQDVPIIPTEYTSWTSLSDLGRRLFFLRDAGGMNYICFDVGSLASETEFRSIPMNKLAVSTLDASASLRSQ